jgi:hypothetical protein
MKNIINIGWLSLVLLLPFASCDQRNKDVVTPIDPNAIPQIILFDEEEAGEFENSDEASFTLTLLDKIDPEGEELGGKIIPLTADVTVKFEVTDIEGFDNIGDYIKDIEAKYEVDDCNDEDVTVAFDPATGQGSVTFPKDVEEVEVTFELDDELLDDDEVNEDDRGFKVVITEIVGGNGVVFNEDLEFEFKVLDNEKIFTEWFLNIEDDLADFLELFGDLDEDVADLEASDIDEITFEFGFDKLEIKIKLEEEEEDECEAGEFDNKEIELEGEYDELTDDDTEGDVKLIVEVENEDGSVEEVEYEGNFEIDGNELTLTLTVGDVEKTLVLYLD